MTLPDARELLEHWAEWPPECEMLHMLAAAFTTWRPQGEMTEDAHRRSLEARWKAGAMNAAQILAAMGGKGGSIRMNGTVVPE